MELRTLFFRVAPGQKADLDPIYSRFHRFAPPRWRLRSAVEPTRTQSE